MKKYLFFGIIAVVILGAVLFLKPSSGVPVIDLTGKKQVEVVLTEEGFVPQDFRISRGTAVIFTTNRDKPFWPASNLHPSHGIYPAFDPREPVAPQSSWSFTFTEVGSWGFHDHIRSYYTGIIEVVE